MPLRLVCATVLVVLVTCLAAITPAQAQSLYPSSVVGTDFDFVLETDPDTFVRLEASGVAMAEMPDKSREGPLRKRAFVFVSHYSDGTRISMAIDAGFETEEAAREEALRYTPRLGKLPTALRRGVSRIVVHQGQEDTTAFSDVGLIVVYAGNATRRISTHDLEETIFHESVHAAWDASHVASAAWLSAQEQDGRFVTEYARKNPKGEDLAESALFAYTLLHHPERIPAPDAARIREAIPARIAFVATLLPVGKPVHFHVGVVGEGSNEKPPVVPGKGPASCSVDLGNAGQLRDIISNALLREFRRDEAAVSAFMQDAERHRDADVLVKATMVAFGLKEAALRAAILRYRHCNCTHGDLDETPPPAK